MWLNLSFLPKMDDTYIVMMCFRERDPFCQPSRCPHQREFASRRLARRFATAEVGLLSVEHFQANLWSNLAQISSKFIKYPSVWQRTVEQFDITGNQKMARWRPTRRIWWSPENPSSVEFGLLWCQWCRGVGFSSWEVTQNFSDGHGSRLA